MISEVDRGRNPKGAGRKRGTPRTGGRAKGTPNKITRDLREMILGALDAAGGEQYLAAQARKNPVAFLGILGRTMPREVKAEIAGRLSLEQLIVGACTPPGMDG